MTEFGVAVAAWVDGVARQRVEVVIAVTSSDVGAPGPSVWRNRDFRLVLVGGLVNDIGDWSLAVALPVYVFTQTHSGRDTAAIFVLEMFVSIAVGPYGGTLADRWDLRRTIVATNVFQAVALLPLLAVTRHRLWPAFVVIAVETMLRQVNDPASFALVPRVVAPDQLVQANAANSTSGSLARLIGSPVGGVIVAFGGLGAVVAVDAASFAAVAVATSFVRTPTASLTAPATPGDIRPDGLRAGLRALRGELGLGGYVAVQALAQLTFAMFPVLFIVFVVDELHGGGTQVGLIRAMAAFGGIVASLVVARTAKRRSALWMMAGGYLGLGAVAAVFVNTPLVTRAFWVYLVLFGLTGLPNVTSQIGASTAAQQICPPAVLGRLSGLLSATGAVGAGIGSVGVGALVDHVSVRALFNVQAALYALCGVGTYLVVIRPRRQAAATASS